jgi:phenylalanyl-tRNA synthetase beta chain
VSVFQESLQAALAPFEVTEESFDALCFEFGLELDDVTSDYEIAKKERGSAAAEGLSQRIIYKVDVPANRYDLLCIEGLVRALQIFKGTIEAPKLVLDPPKPKPQMQMTVHAATAKIRPYVVCAVLRDVSFNPDRYQSFLDLQDKLHQNICRKRTLVAIGTHDLSTIKPPFTYEARAPKDITFVPLSHEEEMDGNRMMEVLSTHQQLKAYLPIIRDSPVYPVIYDSNKVVLSLPPIINGDHSKIRLETKDVFIECTATDLTKAVVVLNTMVAMFAEHCAKPFVIEPVEVIYAKDYPANSFTKGGDKIIYPQLDPREMAADIKRIKSSLSLDQLTEQEVRDLLAKMGVPCQVDNKDKNKLNVQVPVTRSDIMHECDLVEDVAIAYGYNNLKLEVPKTFYGASEQPVNHLSDFLRVELAMAGFTECLNWALVSRKENFTQMRRDDQLKLGPEVKPYEYSPGFVPVAISNPKTKDFEILRTSMIPGMLKTLANAKHNPPPIKVFEVGDVVIQDPSEETGSKNVRRVCAICASQQSNFAEIHGVVDQLMYKVNCEPQHEHTEGSRRRAYTLESSEDPSFFPGMQAHIVVDGSKIGIVGVLHPDVVSHKGFDVGYACTAFELNAEPFLGWL